MNSLLDKFKTKIKPSADIQDYGIPDIFRPSDFKMKEWRELGFVCHDVSNGGVVCYQWVNWALERAKKNVRVVQGNIPSLDMLQLLYDESIKYLQERNIEH